MTPTTAWRQAGGATTGTALRASRARHPRRAMITKSAAALAVAAALSTFGGPAAHAAPDTVSPADEIRAVGATGTEVCTLGYTYTEPGTRTANGITAGHCNKTHSNYVEDHTTGAIGHFVLTAGDPDDPLLDDYGLIDFGANTAVPTMYGMPVVGIAAINEHNAICHDGIRTGTACGQLGENFIGPQYLTNAMPDGIPGDSGGPVWQISRRGAVIVGIWLGYHTDADGTRHGRFIDLDDVADDVDKIGCFPQSPIDDLTAHCRSFNLPTGNCAVWDQNNIMSSFNTHRDLLIVALAQACLDRAGLPDFHEGPLHHDCVIKPNA